MFTRKSLSGMLIASLLGRAATVSPVDFASLTVPANPFAGRARESVGGVNKRDRNRSKYTPGRCLNKRPEERFRRQQAKIAARKAGV